jgi:hypothetical protein
VQRLAGGEDPRGQQPGVTGVADPHCRHGDAGEPERTDAIVAFQRTLRDASLAKDARVQGNA